MKMTGDQWLGIKPVVTEDPPASDRFRVTFHVSRLGQAVNPDGTYPKVPDEARVIIQRGQDGTLHITDYTRPEGESQGAPGTDWRQLAIEAVQAHLQLREAGLSQPS